MKEENRICSPAKPTATPIHALSWTTTRPCANCPAESARASACSTSAPRRSPPTASIVLHPRDNALELANKLLAKYGGLPGLVRADFRELCTEHGMGEAKTAQVKAALEIGRRLGLMHIDAKYKVRTPADAANLVMLDLACLDTEQMRIPLLDAKSQLVEKVEPVPGHRQQLGPARRGDLPPGHHPPPALREPERAFEVGIGWS